MKINKNLKRRIALAIVLGTCFSGVAEAGQSSLYGNSHPSTGFTLRPADGASATGYTFDFDKYNNIYEVFAGYASNTDAVSNVLNFYGGSSERAYGGYAYYGGAYSNKVNFYNGSISNFAGGLTGGYSFDEQANDNIVEINGNLNNSFVYGGRTESKSNNKILKAVHNTININNGGNNVGAATAGSAYLVIDENISQGEIGADYNKVLVDSNGEHISLFGGSAAAFSVMVQNPNTGIYEEQQFNDGAYKISADNNSIVVNNGKILSITAGKATLGPNINNIVDGSYLSSSGNSVIVNNGKVDYVYLTTIGTANNNVIPVVINDNSLTLKNGEISVAIDGVSSQVPNSSSIKVYNNAINVEGGTISGDVTCGRVYINPENVVNIESRNNNFNWYGGNIEGSINGYYYYGAGIRDNLKDSNFNFYASKTNSNKTIDSLSNFENYNFYLDNTVTADSTLINLTGTADLYNSNVGVAVLGSSPLKTGDSVTLLSANSKGAIQTSDNLKNDTSHMRAENISAVYDFTLKNDGMKLTATVGNAAPDTNTTDTNTNTTDTSGINTNPKAENLMEGRAAEAFMTYDKLDIVDKAYQASKHSSTPTTFLDYSYSDVTTKDNTKLRGMNMVWGAASTIGGEKDQGNTLTRGVFLEYGDNSFSSDDHYYNGSIWGSGKGKKTGIGVLLRKVMFDRHYYDAYLRAGTLNTDYSALAEGVGKIKYDNKDLYVSGHFGYGQFIQLTPNLQMDAYAKYFYNRIPGHSTTAYTNDIDPMPISFDTFTNHRLRLGSKFTWDYMDSNNYLFYVDAAIEHERSSDQSGTINGRRISKSNESGTTGVIELGYENNFGFNNAFKFTAKAQGYLGDRRGIGASANISYSF